MFKQFHCWLVVAVVFTAPARASAQAPADADATLPIQPAAVRAHVEFLAAPESQGRGEGPGKQRALEYIVAHYQSLKLKPLFAADSFLQEIPGARSKEGQPTVLGHNIGAWLEGSDPQLRDEVLIVSAHFDHLGVRNGHIFAGADDNATGVAMTLEVARVLSTGKPLPRSVAFINFDLEERLLWGSRWFAAHPPWPLEQVKLFITADLIGRSLGDLPLPTVFAMGSESGTGLRDVLADVGSPPGLEIARLGADLVGTRSDYGPFRDRKIPFLFFSTGQHPDYHTPRDVPERVDFTKLARISTVILGVAQHVGSAETPPAWVNQPGLDLGEAETLHRITDLLLDEAGGQRLSEIQRLLVSNVHTRTAQIIARKEITPDERTWLVRSAQLLLLSVF